MQFLTQYYMTLFGMLAIAITPNEQASAAQRHSEHLLTVFRGLCTAECTVYQVAMCSCPFGYSLTCMRILTNTHRWLQ